MNTYMHTIAVRTLVRYVYICIFTFTYTYIYTYMYICINTNIFGPKIVQNSRSRNELSLDHAHPVNTHSLNILLLQQ